LKKKLIEIFKNRFRPKKVIKIDGRQDGARKAAPLRRAGEGGRSIHFKAMDATAYTDDDQ